MNENMKAKQDSNIEMSNDAGLSSQMRKMTLTLEESSNLANNKEKIEKSKFRRAHRSFLKIFINTQKKKPSKNELDANMCALNKSNAVCFSSCMCGTISARNSPIELEETKNCPVFTGLHKTAAKNQSEYQVETKHEKSIIFHNHKSAVKTTQEPILPQQEKEICCANAVSSSLVNHTSDTNSQTYSKFKYKTSSIKDTADSCRKRNGNDCRGCNQLLSSTKVKTSNKIEQLSTSNAANLSHDSDYASLSPTENSVENYPSVSLMSSDGSLRRYTIDTLTPFGDMPILDDENIHAYLNEYRRSPSKLQGLVSLPSENTIICSDDVFDNDSFDWTVQQRKDKELESLKYKKMSERDSGYYPQYDILSMTEESFIAVPPPSNCSKYSPTKQAEIASSEIQNDDFDASSNEKSFQLSPKYTRKTQFNASNRFYRTLPNHKSSKLYSEYYNTDFVTGNVLMNDLNPRSLPRNMKKFTASSSFPNEIKPHATSAANKYELRTLDSQNLRHEHSKSSKIVSRCSQLLFNNSKVLSDNQKLCTQSSKKGILPFYRVRSCGRKSAKPSDHVVYTYYGYL